MIQKTRTHYYYFNAFRLVAALIVLTSHARCEMIATYSMLEAESQNIMTKLLFALLSFTPHAMSIFFVLSGFLVGGPALEKAWKRLSSNASASDSDVAAYNFMINRIVRITPPLLIAIVFAIIVKIHGGVTFSYFDAFLNLLGLQGVVATDFGGVYWSIAYEVWFYVLIGSMLCVGANRLYKTLGFILFVISGMIFIKLSVVWFFMLLTGVLFYFVRDKITLSKSQIYMCTGALLFLQGLVLLGADSHVTVLPLNGIVNIDMVKWCIAILIGLVMVSLCKKQPKGKYAMLIEKCGNRWAPMTYCLYITHFTSLELYKQLFGQFQKIDLLAIVALIFVCAVCVAIGTFFYNCIEEPLANVLKQRLYKKK